MNTKYNILFLLLFAFGLSQVSGQISKDTDLYKKLKEKDSILFDAAFNQCDIALLKTLFSKDLEFYHDKGGLTLGLGNFLSSLEKGCAERAPGGLQPSKRYLIPESLEVFPLYNNDSLYGAIQQGNHRFEFLNGNKVYQQGDLARFTHLWILEKESWKLKRVLSYDHRATPGQK